MGYETQLLDPRDAHRNRKHLKFPAVAFGAEPPELHDGPVSPIGPKIEQRAFDLQEFRTTDGVTHWRWKNVDTGELLPLRRDSRQRYVQEIDAAERTCAVKGCMRPAPYLIEDFGYVCELHYRTS